MVGQPGNQPQTMAPQRIYRTFQRVRQHIAGVADLKPQHMPANGDGQLDTTTGMLDRIADQLGNHHLRLLAQFSAQLPQRTHLSDDAAGEERRVRDCR